MAKIFVFYLYGSGVTKTVGLFINVMPLTVGVQRPNIRGMERGDG